jgi:hypothetical protein
MAGKHAKSKDNNCPDCKQPPETSGEAPDGATVYTCAAGHQWTRKENKG